MYSITLSIIRPIRLSKSSTMTPCDDGILRREHNWNGRGDVHPITVQCLLTLPRPSLRLFDFLKIFIHHHAMNKQKN